MWGVPIKPVCICVCVSVLCTDPVRAFDSAAAGGLCGVCPLSLCVYVYA